MSDFAPAAGTAAALAQAQAAVHGSTVVFWWGAGILTVGAVVTALLFERGQAPAPATSSKPAPPRSTPSATELLDALTYAASGIGIAFFSFLAAIPGLLPVVALTAVAAAV